MVKKKQPDFHKTQLKPGRTVSKRKNITNTKFKAKKIAIPNKGSKARGPESKTIPECLKIIKEVSLSGARIGALQDLNRLIDTNPDSLPSFLSEILGSILKLMLDPEEPLRFAATVVIFSILKNTNQLQLQSFVPHFNNILACAMTHVNIKIKEHSLLLLKALLEHHPDLICNSFNILNDLLQMVMGLHRTRTKQKNVPVFYAEGISSPHWRIHVLDHINIFLKQILKNKSNPKEEERDEQEVYWDCKSPLNIPVFAEGGLKPLDIEKTYCRKIDTGVFCDDSEEEIQKFIRGILRIVPQVFTEEMASEPKSDDHLLSASTINNLNIVFQVLASVADWLVIVPSDEQDKVLKKFLKDRILGEERFPFNQRGPVIANQKMTPACAQLNLAVCYLFSQYLVDPENDNLNGSIFAFIDLIIKASYEIKYQSIPILVKIMNVYFNFKEKPEVAEFLRVSLSNLCSVLRTDDHPNRHILTSLFAKMSLDSTYSFVAETDGMKIYYNWLFLKLPEMCTTGEVDKKILSVIKKIANRKYPCFQQLLSGYSFSYFEELLRFDDGDVRDAAIFLIYNKEELDIKFLFDISKFILGNSTFPKVFAVRLLRLLTYRFSEEPPKGAPLPKPSIYNAGLLDIVPFFVNIAIDYYNLQSEEFLDYEENEYTRAVKVIKDAASFNIIPSLYWKEHSEIFEVCAHFLNQLNPNETVKNVVIDIIMTQFKDILRNTKVFPMHTAIAILKLNRSEMRDRFYRMEMYHLMFSAFLTISVLTNMPLDNTWCQYNVDELSNCMELNSKKAIKVILLIEYLHDELEGIAVYHMLRVIKYFFSKQLLDPKDLKDVIDLMEILKKKCVDTTIEQQPLFNFLYEQLHYYV